MRTRLAALSAALLTLSLSFAGLAQTGRRTPARTEAARTETRDLARDDSAKLEVSQHGAEDLRGPARTGDDRALPPASAQRALNAVTAAAAKVKDPVVVFDIDDTAVSTKTHEAAPGVVRYTEALIAAGAKIVFLTGRPERKRAFTVAQLKSLGFPTDAAHVVLLMNPKGGPPEPFKARAKPALEKEGTPIAFFDNEKNELQMFSQQYASAKVFELNTVSASQYKGSRPASIDVISDFQ